MTVITKPISGKKSDKLQDPLVINEQLPAGKDVEANGGQDPHAHPVIDNLFLFRAQRSRALNTLFLLLTALLVTSIGIFSGMIVYRQYTQMNRIQQRFYLPREGASEDTMLELESYNRDRGFFNELRSWGLGSPPTADHVEEDVDLDAADGNFAKITVPQFKGGPNTRFIHDFNANLTGIVDFNEQTCYIMPLNRSVIKKPKDLIDVFQNVISGTNRYSLDPEEIRENWRIITPAVSNEYLASRSEILSDECLTYSTYKLEKIVSGVFKRSLDGHEYTEKIGLKTVKFYIHP